MQHKSNTSQDTARVS